MRSLLHCAAGCLALLADVCFADAPVLSVEQADAARAAGDWRPHPMSLAPAKWIWLPGERTLPNTFVLFRKEIGLPAAPESASGWIAADTRYTLTVNGKRVQWGPAPCDPRNLDADPVDLKSSLRPGNNVIGIQVHFFGHGDGTWPGGRPGLIFQANIRTAAGTQQIISDQSWQCLPDRAHEPGRYKRWFLRALQEQFDARLHPSGWDMAGFGLGQDWIAAAEIPCPPDKPSGCRKDGHWSQDSIDHLAPETSHLRMRQIPVTSEVNIPVKGLAHSGRVRWTRDPADWFDFRMPGSFEVLREPVAAARGSGTWELPAATAGEGMEAAFELPEQMAGFPRFVIDAPAGTIVELMVQEAHDPAMTRWLDTYHYCWSRFICREGRNEFETADYESFRWLQLHVRNHNRPVRISQVAVRRRLYPWPHQPVIQVEEPALQRLFDASINTLNNSALDSIVDGGGRERQQYSGDGGHQLHAIRYAFGEYRMPARFLRTFSEGMTKDGFFLDCYPAYDRLARLPQRELDAAFWGPLLDHGIGFNFDCWHHYLQSGDQEALAEAYPRLKRFAAYLWNLRDGAGLLPVENLGVANVWIDHNAFRQQRHKQCAFNLYAAAMLANAFAPIAELFGEQACANDARKQAAELLSAATAKFWSPEHRTFVDNLPWVAEDHGIRLSDRTLATAILYQQCPGGDTAAALKALVECPREMGLSYPCNANWRYWALGAMGRADVILADFRQRWATMRSVLENNTLQEDWKAAPDSRSQWSHCPLAPVFVFYQEVLGLKPLTPAFSRVQVRPQLEGLPGKITAVAHTPRGPIRFEAERAAEKPTVRRNRLALPRGVDGELLLPEGVPVTLELLPKPAQPGLCRYRIPEGGCEWTGP